MLLVVNSLGAHTDFWDNFKIGRHAPGYTTAVRKLKTVHKISCIGLSDSEKVITIVKTKIFTSINALTVCVGLFTHNHHDQNK